MGGELEECLHLGVQDVLAKTNVLKIVEQVKSGKSTSICPVTLPHSRNNDILGKKCT